MTVIAAADRLNAAVALNRPLQDRIAETPVSPMPFAAVLAGEEGAAKSDSPASVKGLGGGGIVGGAVRVAGLSGIAVRTADVAAGAVEGAPSFSGAEGASSAGSDGLGKIGTLDVFAGKLKAMTASLAETLNRRFALADVDTRIPIQMDVKPDGSIVVRGDHPDKAKIERVFADDPELANLYRGISSAHGFVAHARLAVKFEEDLDKAKGDKERERVWRRYEPLFKQIEAASGQMTLSGGALTSGAVDMASALTRMPSWAMGV